MNTSSRVLLVRATASISHFSARSNEVVQYEAANIPLGILPEGDFASIAIEAEPGSLFALYTDGFVECANAAGEEFGIQRLFLVSHGRRLPVAAFLGPNEKASFATALSAALGEARRGPTRTVLE